MPSQPDATAASPPDNATLARLIEELRTEAAALRRDLTDLRREVIGPGVDIVMGEGRAGRAGRRAARSA